MTGYSELKQAMREQLVVNAGVIIREQFRKRLRAYVLIKFGKTGDDLTSEEEKASEKLVGQIMYACYNVEEADMLEALQMRDVIMPDGEEWSEKWIPWPDNIKKNGMEFYIRLIWEFQSVVKDRMEAVPNEKGVRALSLFPVSTYFTNLHIVINGTTLAGFLSRIRDRGQGNLMEDWNMPQMKISTASFKVMRWTVMRRAFAIGRFETRKEECHLTKTEFLQLPVEEKYEHASHLFANEIKTDRHLAGFNRFRAWNESQKRKFPDYKSVIEGIPSFKTSSYEKYPKRLDYFWQHAAFLLRFCLERPYLKWCFFQKRMARVAVDEIARRIVPTSGQGVEGGAAEARGGGFHGRVQDEQALLAVPPVTFQRAVPDPGLPQGRPETQEEEDEEKVLSRDWSRAEIKSKHCHVVLRCENEDCEARYWDRDVNAAINMLELLKSEVQGRGRMGPFRRS
ncbi:hypothetical protein PI124_g11309 [Phytophthora idaei]|nr:hypothetical protein PI125_g10273 [Phytophthora idaei]KAG3243893.1 hypothetical protein PI124_g11309 [Phytophthora idaei]